MNYFPLSQFFSIPLLIHFYSLILIFFYFALKKNEEYNIQTICSGTENDVKLRNNFALRAVQSAGRALKTARDRIPVHRRQELEAIIKDHYQVLISSQRMIKKTFDQ